MCAFLEMSFIFEIKEHISQNSLQHHDKSQKKGLSRAQKGRYENTRLNV